jgi:hypothetical protein
LGRTRDFPEYNIPDAVTLAELEAEAAKLNGNRECTNSGKLGEEYIDDLEIVAAGEDTDMQYTVGYHRVYRLCHFLNLIFEGSYSSLVVTDL